MLMHAYQVQRIFHLYGLPILRGGVAYTPSEAVAVSKNLRTRSACLKAQIYSSGRSKGTFKDSKLSGVVFAHTPKKIEEKARSMLGHYLVTKSTGENGTEVKKIYVEERVNINRSYVISIKIDFDKERVFLTAYDEKKPDEKPLVYDLDILHQVGTAKALMIATKLVGKTYAKRTAKTIQALHRIFIDYAAFEVEINPLVITDKKQVIALEGNITFDPDAKSRYREFSVMRDVEDETENEKKARLNNFRYLKLDGNIGCIVNGSGLGIATLDLLQMQNGKVASLFDVGAMPSEDATTSAFKAVLSEPDVEGILVNIFGGNARCDVIAKGLVSAARQISVGLPIVVRMQGTNSQIGQRILFESGLPFIVEETMDKAVQRIIGLVQEII